MYETRPLPKKTIIIIGILIIIGIIFYFLVEIGKAQKAQKALEKVGYINISNLSVASRTKFKNDTTNVDGYKYTIKFQDLKTNKECKGFIWVDFKRNILQDIECK